MPAAGGRHILVGGGDEFINVGFDPDLVLLFHSNHTVEGTREDLGGLIGFGTISRTLPTEIPYPAPASATAHMLWHNNLAVSAYNNDVAVWGRATNGVDGYAFYGLALGGGGFTIQYSGGFAGSGGHPLYWLAFGEEDDLVTHRGFFYAGKAEEPTPFKPTLGFFVGSGGTGSGADGGDMAFTDYAVSTWGMWAADDGQADPPSSWANRALSATVAFNANAGNNSFFVLEGFIGNNNLYASALRIGTAMPFGMFSHYRTDTAYGALEGNPGIGFDDDSGRLSVVATSRLVGVTGTFTPGATVGDKVEVPIPFDVAAVIFLTRLDNDYSGIPVHFIDGLSEGFVVEDGFQAVVASAGRAFDGPAMARYQNQGRAWISSMQAGSAGLHAGTAEIAGSGFITTTTEASRVARPVSFLAIGLPEEVPGFFRIL